MFNEKPSKDENVAKNDTKHNRKAERCQKLIHILLLHFSSRPTSVVKWNSATTQVTKREKLVYCENAAAKIEKLEFYGWKCGSKSKLKVHKLIFDNKVHRKLQISREFSQNLHSTLIQISQPLPHLRSLPRSAEAKSLICAKASACLDVKTFLQTLKHTSSCTKQHVGEARIHV